MNSRSLGFFETTVEFRPRLQAQRDHAKEHGQAEREVLYEGLLSGVDSPAAETQ